MRRVRRVRAVPQHTLTPAPAASELLHVQRHGARAAAARGGGAAGVNIMLPHSFPPHGGGSLLCVCVCVCVRARARESLAQAKWGAQLRVAAAAARMQLEPGPAHSRRASSRERYVGSSAAPLPLPRTTQRRCWPAVGQHATPRVRHLSMGGVVLERQQLQNLGEHLLHALACGDVCNAAVAFPDVCARSNEIDA